MNSVKSMLTKTIIIATLALAASSIYAKDEKPADVDVSNLPKLVTNLQKQVQQVSDSIPKQIKMQANATQKHFDTANKATADSIKKLQQQISTMQTNLTGNLNQQAAKSNKEISQVSNTYKAAITSLQKDIQTLNAKISQLSTAK